MAVTQVYGCDWCDTIIEKDHEGKPKFAARITAEQLRPLPPIGEKPKIHRICSTCRDAFQALTEGRYRRG